MAWCSSGHFALMEVGEFEIALARHGTDLERPAAFLDAGHALDPVKVDEMVGLHEAHVEHRHQRLAAGQELGVVELAQQAHGLGKRFRIVVLKGWRLHRGPGAKAAASIGTRRDLEQPLMRRLIVVGLFLPAVVAHCRNRTRAQNVVADFYRGRNVDLIVGYSPAAATTPIPASWRGTSASTFPAIPPSWCRTCRAPARSSGQLSLQCRAEGRLDHRHIQPRHGDGAADRRSQRAIRLDEVHLARQRHKRDQRVRHLAHLAGKDLE